MFRKIFLWCLCLIVSLSFALSGYVSMSPSIPLSRHLHYPYYSTDLLGDTSSTTSIVSEPWFSVLIASATQATADGGTNHPGAWRCTSSTTTNSGCAIRTRFNNTSFLGGEFTNIVFYIDTLALTTIRLGYHDSVTSADAVDGGYIEIPATGDAVCKTASNSVRTTSGTIATLAQTTWYHALIYTDANATALTCELYSEAGALLGSQTNTTNIPSSSGVRVFGNGAIATNSGVAAIPLLIVDFLDIGWTRSLVRGKLP